jgi:hypothetical protein
MMAPASMFTIASSWDRPKLATAAAPRSVSRSDQLMIRGRDPE